jgi:hypothetical protein
MTEDPPIHVIDISDQTTNQQTGKRRNPTLKYRRRNRDVFQTTGTDKCMFSDLQKQYVW